MKTPRSAESQIQWLHLIRSQPVTWEMLEAWFEPFDERLETHPHAPLLCPLLGFGQPVEHGRLVQAVAVPWYSILQMIARDPESIYQIDPFIWEEIIAGAYVSSGFEEVILTPRSGDRGRDVIATKTGVGSIRIFDQVKAYGPGHVVTAREVHAMLGVITSQRNVSKGIVTTTSTFAPRVLEDEDIAAYVPYRLELKPRDTLLAWLGELRGRKSEGVP
jgi:restriction system protein